jgi:hypothetical protein
MIETLTRERPKEQDQKNKDDNVCHIIGTGDIGLCGEYESCHASWDRGRKLCHGCGRKICPNCIYIKDVRAL